MGYSMNVSDLEEILKQIDKKDSDVVLDDNQKLVGVMIEYRKDTTIIKMQFDKNINKNTTNSRIKNMNIKMLSGDKKDE